MKHGRLCDVEVWWPSVENVACACWKCCTQAAPSWDIFNLGFIIFECCTHYHALSVYCIHCKVSLMWFLWVYVQHFYVKIYDCVKCFSHFSCLWCSAHRTFSTVVAKMVSYTRLICVKKSLISELTFGHIWLLECFYKTFTVSVTDSVIVEQLHRVPMLIDVAAFSL